MQLSFTLRCNEQGVLWGIKKWDIFRPLFLYFRLFKTVDSKWQRAGGTVGDKEMAHCLKIGLFLKKWVNPGLFLFIFVLFSSQFH